MSQQREQIGLQGTGQHRRENCQELLNLEHASVSFCSNYCSGNERFILNFFESEVQGRRWEVLACGRLWGSWHQHRGVLPKHPPGKGCCPADPLNLHLETPCALQVHIAVGLGETDCLSNRFTAGDTNLGLTGRRVLHPVQSGASLRGWDHKEPKNKTQEMTNCQCFNI